MQSNVYYIVVVPDHRDPDAWRVVNTTTRNLSSAKAHATRLKKKGGSVKILAVDIALLVPVTDDVQEKFDAAEAAMLAAGKATDELRAKLSAGVAREPIPKGTSRKRRARKQEYGAFPLSDIAASQSEEST